MATFRKRGRYWQAQIIRKGYPSQYKTFDTKAEAEAWATIIESEMSRGAWVNRAEAEATSLQEALDRYAREITVGKKGSVRELSRIGIWKKHPLALRSLASLRGVDFAAYRDERLGAGAASNTVRLELAIISHLFTIATKEWGLEGLTNPIQHIRMPANSRPRDRRLQGDEEPRLFQALANCGNEWMAPLAILAIETAMREGELLELYWDRVDLNKRVITLPVTKNGSPRRVPLSTRATETLNTLPRSITGRVFPLTQTAVIQAFDRARIQADIENIRFHDLRHEATSRLFEKGLNMMEVAAITGHKSLQMLKRYTHLRAEDLVRKLG